MPSKIFTQPATEPITLAEAKLHLRVEVSDDDKLITNLIVAARERAEALTGQSFMPQTWETVLDAFSTEIDLDHPPIVSVTHVKYLDGAGALQTVSPSDYIVDTFRQPGRITLAEGAVWPATQSVANAVTVRYVTGYANAAAVPQAIKGWMLLRIGMMYANRESVVVGASVAEIPFVDSLLDDCKVY